MIKKTEKTIEHVRKWGKGTRYILSTDGGNSGTDPRCPKYGKGLRPGPADIKKCMGELKKKHPAWNIIGGDLRDWTSLDGDYENPIFGEYIETLYSVFK